MTQDKINSKESLLKAKENLLIRFLHLTEEALKKVGLSEEEKVAELIEKREKIIIASDAIDPSFSEYELTKEESDRLLSIKTDIVNKNKELQMAAQKQMELIKKDIGTNKQALKVNRAYHVNDEQSYYVNKKN